MLNAFVSLKCSKKDASIMYKSLLPGETIVILGKTMYVKLVMGKTCNIPINVSFNYSTLIHSDSSKPSLFLKQWKLIAS